MLILNHEILTTRIADSTFYHLLSHLCSINGSLGDSYESRDICKPLYAGIRKAKSGYTLLSYYSFNSQCRRQVFWISKQILQLMMEDAIDDWLLRQIQWLRRDDVIALGIRWVQDVRTLHFSRLFFLLLLLFSLCGLMMLQLTRIESFVIQGLDYIKMWEVTFYDLLYLCFQFLVHLLGKCVPFFFSLMDISPKNFCH